MRRILIWNIGLHNTSTLCTRCERIHRSSSRHAIISITISLDAQRRLLLRISRDGNVSKPVLRLLQIHTLPIPTTREIVKTADTSLVGRGIQQLLTRSGHTPTPAILLLRHIQHSLTAGGALDSNRPRTSLLKHAPAQDITSSGACLSVAAGQSERADGDFNESLQRIEEETEYEDAGMEEEDDVADPAFGCFCDTQSWDECDAEEDCDQADHGEGGVIEIHARLDLEGPEAVEGENENDFANGQNDDLGCAAGLDGAEGNAAEECD